MKELVQKLPDLLGQAFLPHYKEDAFRTIFAGLALREGWTLLEPRPGGKEVDDSKVKVYRLAWRTDDGIHREPDELEKSVESKPDLRLVNDKTLFIVEIKCGFTGSASEANSNAKKVAEDIDLVSKPPPDGVKFAFFGLFDREMLERVQAEKSGKRAPKRHLGQLLESLKMDDLHKKDEKPVFPDTPWGRGKKAPLLRTTAYPIVCQAKEKLALVVVRRTDAGF
jgi:hypothetical protein